MGFTEGFTWVIEFTEGFTWVSLMVLLGFHLGFTWASMRVSPGYQTEGFTWVSLWVSPGFHLGFTRVSPGFHLGFTEGFTYGCLFAIKHCVTENSFSRDVNIYLTIGSETRFFSPYLKLTSLGLLLRSFFTMTYLTQKFLYISVHPNGGPWHFLWLTDASGRGSPRSAARRSLAAAAAAATSPTRASNWST